MKLAMVVSRGRWIQAHYKRFANESLNGERGARDFLTPALNER
jgi:hypothetical protein